MSTEKKRLLVDFDRVVHKYSKSWHDGTIYDEPVEGAIEALKMLSRIFDVQIFTAFSKRGAARNRDISEWLRKYGLDLPVTSVKHDAVYFIDDKAIRFINWDLTLKIMRAELPEGTL